MDRPNRAFATVLALAAFLIAILAFVTGAAWLATAAAATAGLAALSVLWTLRKTAARESRRTPAAAEGHGPSPAAFAVPATSTTTVPASPAPDRHVPAPAVAPVSAPTVSTSADEPPTSHRAPLPAERPGPGGSVRAPVSPEPEDVLEALLESSRRAGMPVSASLWLDDPATATVRRVAAIGSLPPAEDFERTDSSLLGEAATSGSARFGPLTRMRAGGAETVVWRFAVPLSAGDARGALALDMAGSEPDKVAMGAVVAALRPSLAAALALHVARVEAMTAETLIDAAHDLARLLRAEDVVAASLERAMRLSSSQTGSVMLLGDDGKLTIAAARGLPEGVVEGTSISEGEGIAGWVLASGQPVVVEDLEGRGPQSRRHGIRSAISVPIADQDGLLGVLNVGSRRMQARFSRSHVKALETLGRCTALALRNARAAESSADLYFDSLKALALAIETKDPYARGATDRVVTVATALGSAMALDDDEQRSLKIASLLHDIGMDAAGEGLSTQRRSLSTVEWGMVQLHPSIAAELLEQTPSLRDVVPIVYHHHEHYDGRGYVAGISGDRIPLGARILAVADAWVAMTSARSYRPAHSADAALSELRDKSGSQFDPLVVETFAALLADGRIPSPVG